MNYQFASSLPQSWTKFSRFFSALGDTTRQKILLLFEQNEEICVNDIARLFSLSRPAISHHLKILREAEIVACEKRGREIYYRINYLHCNEVLSAMLQCMNTEKPKTALPSKPVVHPALV